MIDKIKHAHKLISSGKSLDRGDMIDAGVKYLEEAITEASAPTPAPKTKKSAAKAEESDG